MEIIRSVKEMQASSEAARRKGETIAFVPTMGYFHEGHLNLMREGRARAERLVVSIYVNPTQFGPGEDLDRYPRDFERDQRMASDVGVDTIFFPPTSEMYPERYQTYVNVEGVTQNLCGFSRPGHFRGVTTICTKLFNMVKPHVAVFGKKDFQQLVTIKRMVADLNMDLEIVGMPTTREADGLAMSSRNTYLDGEQRKSALCLSRALKKAQGLYEGGQRNAAAILGEVRTYIDGNSQTVIDYAKICDTTTLEDVDVLDRESVLALAVKVGSIRLIDNHVFGEPLDI